jgi:hypothetical protein
MSTRLLAIIVVFSLGVTSALRAEFPREQTRSIGEFLDQHCVKCHGREKQKG